MHLIHWLPAVMRDLHDKVQAFIIILSWIS